MGVVDYLASLNDGNLSSGEITLSDGTPAILLVNPTKVECGIAEQGSDLLVVLHTREGESNLVIDLQPSSTLKIIHVSLAAAECRCELRQQSHSECYISSIAVGGGKLDYVVNLNESHAYSSLRSAFIAGGKERVKVGVKVNHNVADCNSFSLVKGIAGAEAVGEFEGMVYVAPDAQRTDAVQTSRNIVIGDTARIQTKPQLEIYADDVKCAHGSTVGVLDTNALFYMQQRGIPLEEARMLLMFAFVGQVIDQVTLEPLRDRLHYLVEKRFRGELNKCTGCALCK